MSGRCARSRELQEYSPEHEGRSGLASVVRRRGSRRRRLLSDVVVDDLQHARMNGRHWEVCHEVGSM